MSSIDRSLRRWAPALLLPLALAACATPQPKTADKTPEARNPLEQHNVQTAEVPERLALGVHEGGAISPAQEAALRSFAQGWREAGGSAYVNLDAPFNTPSGDAQPQLLTAAARLEALGVPREALRIGRYDAQGRPAPRWWPSTTASKRW